MFDKLPSWSLASDLAQLQVNDKLGSLSDDGVSAQAM